MRRRSRPRRVLRWIGLYAWVFVIAVWLLGARFSLSCACADVGGFLGPGVIGAEWDSDRGWAGFQWDLKDRHRFTLWERRLPPYPICVPALFGSPFAVAIPLYLVLVPAVVTALVVWRRGPPPGVPGHCQKCGYDLTGNVSGVCPECGTPVKHEAKTP